MMSNPIKTEDIAADATPIVWVKSETVEDGIMNRDEHQQRQEPCTDNMERTTMFMPIKTEEIAADAIPFVWVKAEVVGDGTVDHDEHQQSQESCADNLESYNYYDSPTVKIEVEVEDHDILEQMHDEELDTQETQQQLSTDKDVKDVFKRLEKINCGSNVTEESCSQTSDNHKKTKQETLKDNSKGPCNKSIEKEPQNNTTEMMCDISNYDLNYDDVSTNILEHNIIEAVNEPPTSTSQRSWDRRNCCFYCEKLVTNFTRHLIRNHPEETEVLKLIAITDSNPKLKKQKRQAITDNLRNRGNYIHNSNVVSRNTGHLIPARRKKDEDITRSPTTFVVCKKCLGTYRRSTFYRHSKKCNLDSKNDFTMKHTLARNALTILPTFTQAPKEFRENIMPRLRNDEISLIVKQDPLIIAYGCRLLKKKKERSRKAISSKMRDLAHLLKIVREKDPGIVQLQQLIDPKYYECFIEAVKVMSGFNEESGFVKVISIPARLRSEILGCIEILFTNTIMDTKKSAALKENIKNKLNVFKLLLEANWHWEISSNAEKNRKRNLMTKSQVMPLEQDINEIMIKVHELEKVYNTNLKKDRTNVNYNKLSSAEVEALTDDESNEEVVKQKQKRRKKTYNKLRSAEVEVVTADESDEEVVIQKQKRRKKTYNKWSSAEVESVMRHLKKYISMKQNPGKAACEAVLRKEPALHKRTWMQINTYINNIYKKQL